MRPLFNTDPIAGLIYWGTLAGWFVVEARQSARGRDEATDKDAGSRSVLRVTIFAGIFVAVTVAKNIPAARIHASRVTIFVVALGVIWSGMALRYWAFHTLGRYFTFTVMTSSDQPLVSGGPYRMLRHPGYAGGVLILAGIGLALGNWLSLAANTVIPLAGIINRITVEERALRGSLGDAYASFARSRRRLLPFVW
jgi:protein-S-isoprenylcysteine O-methyltransferase Ste14